MIANGSTETEASKLLKEINEWLPAVVHYGAVSQDQKDKRTSFFNRLSILAKNFPQDFINTISIKEINNYFFVELMLLSPETARIFLHNASYDRLKDYAESLFANHVNRLEHYYGSSVKPDEDKDTIEKLKATTDTIIDCMSKTYFSEIERNSICDIVLSKIFQKHFRFIDDTKSQLRDPIKKFISLLISNNYEDRYPYLKEAVEAKEHDLAFWILEQNKNIPAEHPKAKDLAAVKFFLEHKDYLERFADGGDNFFATLLQQSAADKDTLDACLKFAIIKNNKCAIKFLSSHLQKHEWNKFSYIQWMVNWFVKNPAERGDGREVRNVAIQGYMTYLGAVDISLYALLKHMYDQKEYPALDRFITAVTGDVSDYNKSSKDRKTFYDYEDGKTKGLFYFLAEHPAICKSFDTAVSVSLDQKFPAKPKNNEIFGFLSKSKNTAQPIEGIFIKDNKELCPLTKAVTVKNIEFLKLATNIFERRDYSAGYNAPVVTASTGYKTQVVTAIASLKDEGIEIGDILENCLQKHPSNAKNEIVNEEIPRKKMCCSIS